MPFVLILLMIGLIGGQITAYPADSAVRVTLLDGTVLLVLLYGAYRSGKKRFIPLLWIPILSFSVVTLVSLAVAQRYVPTYVVGEGLLYIFRWIAYGALYWVAASALFTPRVWITALVGSGIGIGIMGFLQYILYPNLQNLYYLGWDPHYQRLFSTLLDPNFTGIILAVTSLVLLGMLVSGKQSIWRIVGLFITTGALTLTYSRSSLLAFLVGLFVWGIVAKKKIYVTVVVIIVMAILIVLPDTGEGRNFMRTASSYARLENAQRAITLIREKPVLGHGFNIIRHVKNQRGWTDEINTPPSRAGAGLDTSILFVGATTGLIGIVVYGWMVINFYRLGFRALVSKRTRDVGPVYIGALTAILVHSIFINSLFYPWVMVWIWVGTGCLENFMRREKVFQKHSG